MFIQFLVKALACNNLLFKVVCKMHRKYLTISICNNSVLCNSFITYNYACEGVDFFNLPTVSGQNTPFLVLYLVPSNVNFMVLRICNLFSLKHLDLLSVSTFSFCSPNTFPLDNICASNSHGN